MHGVYKGQGRNQRELLADPRLWGLLLVDAPENAFNMVNRARFVVMECSGCYGLHAAVLTLLWVC